MAARPFTVEDLARDLRDIGVLAGDTLFVHSSLNSLGPMLDGAATIISALEVAVEHDGLLLMPSFNLVERARRAETWDVKSTPSTVGWITEFFRQMPGTHRSDHYSHSVAARGRGALEFVAGHLSDEGPVSRWDVAPWGCTYGRDSPMHRAYERSGKMLLIGVDWDVCTFTHLVEVLHGNGQYAAGTGPIDVSLKRPELGSYWDSHGQVSRGRIGSADSRLVEIKPFVDGLLAEVRRNPEPYVNPALASRSPGHR